MFTFFPLLQSEQGFESLTNKICIDSWNFMSYIGSAPNAYATNNLPLIPISPLIKKFIYIDILFFFSQKFIT